MRAAVITKPAGRLFIDGCQDENKKTKNIAIINWTDFSVLVLYTQIYFGDNAQFLALFSGKNKKMMSAKKFCPSC